MLHKRHRPLLKRLGKHSVVGVSESLLNNYTLLVPSGEKQFLSRTAPSIIPFQALNID